MDDEPRWLDESERATWLSLLAMLALLPTALDTQLQRDAGLSRFEYVVMAVLSEQPDRTLQLKYLALLTSGSLSRLSHLLTRLERRGCVRRHTSEVDGRATVATLTQQGYDIVVAAAPGHVSEVRRLVFDQLSHEEVAVLGSIAARVTREIEGDRPALRPPPPPL